MQHIIPCWMVLFFGLRPRRRVWARFFLLVLLQATDIVRAVLLRHWPPGASESEEELLESHGFYDVISEDTARSEAGWMDPYLGEGSRSFPTFRYPPPVPYLNWRGLLSRMPLMRAAWRLTSLRKRLVEATLLYAMAYGREKALHLRYAPRVMGGGRELSQMLDVIVECQRAAVDMEERAADVDAAEGQVRVASSNEALAALGLQYHPGRRSGAATPHTVLTSAPTVQGTGGTSGAGAASAKGTQGAGAGRCRGTGGTGGAGAGGAQC